MEAVILAGGFGTRLQSVVPDLPKPMAPISGRPFLEILLNSLHRKGFERVVLSLGYRAEQIKAHFGNHYLDLIIDYVVEKTPLGTGGATRLALSRCTRTPVFIFNGDTYLDLDISALHSFWDNNRKPIIVAKRLPDTCRYGSLLLSQERVVGFQEKGNHGDGLINAGCYVFSKDFLDGFPLLQAFSLESDFLSQTVASTELLCFEAKGIFIDIGIPEDYRLAQTLLAEIQ